MYWMLMKLELPALGPFCSNGKASGFPEYQLPG
jgi:hypothetical protein